MIPGVPWSKGQPMIPDNSGSCGKSFGKPGRAFSHVSTSHILLFPSKLGCFGNDSLLVAGAVPCPGPCCGLGLCSGHALELLLCAGGCLAGMWMWDVNPFLGNGLVGAALAAGKPGSLRGEEMEVMEAQRGWRSRVL